METQSNSMVNGEESVLSALELSKEFGTVKALDQVTCRISGSSIFGLIGSNGAGKSTFLRLAAGVYKPTAGQMLFKGKAVFENASAKQEILFVADQPYFPFETLEKMARLFRSLYLNWDQALYQELLRVFPLGEKNRLDRMSKGLQRQAAVLLAIAAGPKLLLMDEAFDGLDPVMRQNLKRVLARQVANQGMTVLIASQNLRELEDFCDHVGLLHQGGLLFVEELDKLRLSIVKIQAAFSQPVSQSQLAQLGLNILQYKERGSLVEILARGTEEEVKRLIWTLDPLLFDVLPLSLEEVFIYELSLRQYAVSELLA